MSRIYELDNFKNALEEKGWTTAINHIYSYGYGFYDRLKYGERRKECHNFCMNLLKEKYKGKELKDAITFYIRKDYDSLHIPKIEDFWNDIIAKNFKTKKDLLEFYMQVYREKIYYIENDLYKDTLLMRELRKRIPKMYVKLIYSKISRIEATSNYVYNKKTGRLNLVKNYNGKISKRLRKMYNEITEEEEKHVMYDPYYTYLLKYNHKKGE